MKYNKRLKNQTTLENSEGVKTVTSKEFSIAINGDSYYYTFINMMSPFYEINCITDAKVLAYMCERCEFNTGIVKITPADRKALVALTGVMTQAISNAISRLRGLGLISGGGGVYSVNPEIWWKGSMKTRSELLEKEGFSVSFNFKKTLTNVNGKLVNIETGEVK